MKNKALEKMLSGSLERGIAQAIRYATTFHPKVTLAEMIEAGKNVGLNPATVKTQFYKARKEDAQMDRAQRRFEKNQTEVIEVCPSAQYTTIVVARHCGIRYIGSFMTHSGEAMGLRREKIDPVGHYRKASLKIERNRYIAEMIWKATKQKSK